MKVFELFGTVDLKDGDVQRKLDEIDKKGKKTSESFKKVGEAVKKIGKVALVGATAVASAITLITKKAVDEGAKLQQSMGGIETLYKSNADTMIKHANSAFKTTGQSANEYMETVTGFSASLINSLGGDTEKAAKISHMAMVDMSDNSNKLGSNMEDIKNAYGGFAKSNYSMLDNLKLGYGKMKCRIKSRLTVLSTGVHTQIKNKYVLIGNI